MSRRGGLGGSLELRWVSHAEGDKASLRSKALGDRSWDVSDPLSSWGGGWGGIRSLGDRSVLNGDHDPPALFGLRLAHGPRWRASSSPTLPSLEPHPWPEA